MVQLQGHPDSRALHKRRAHWDTQRLYHVNCTSERTRTATVPAQVRPVLHVHLVFGIWPLQIHTKYTCDTVVARGEGALARAC